MLALIRQAEASLVRRRFASSAELIAGLYAVSPSASCSAVR